MRELRLGERRVGPGRPVYFIAEAGSNHDRDLGQARKLVEVAAQAGADAVKFQTFRAEHLYPRSAGMTDYLKVPRPIFDIIRDLEMPLEWIPELAAHCRANGVDFLSTPFDEASADALAPHVAAFKIASYEMTHHGLVQHCARKGKPLIVSTGTANLDEVRELVEAVRATADVELALLQCTARYPAPLTALNLRAIATLAAAFDVPVGLSDHSREPLAGPMAAVALGASIIEKHFTLSNSLPGPDHAYALEPRELADVIERVREVERALGTGDKVPQPVEAELRRFARRSIFTRRAVRAGERLSVESCGVLRCGKLAYGLHPREFIRLLGRAARRELPADATLVEADLEPLELGGAVKLRPLREDDAELVVAWRARPDVQSQLFSADAPTRAEQDAWFRKYQLRGDRVEFVILDEGAPVGTAGLSGIDLGARVAELGILVGEPTARGRGVATRASRLLLELGFSSLGLERVRLELYRDNAAARRLYDRLGFVEETPAPAAREKGGVARAVTAMRLERAAWKSA